MSFNRIQLVGNLGRNPETHYTSKGMAVCNFTLATNEKRKDKNGQERTVTTWFRVTLWGRQAEIAQAHLVKGRQVFIEGRMRVEDWTDRDGAARYTVEVHGTGMQFVGSNEAETKKIDKVENAVDGYADSVEDDVPF